jgi:hypothetical protein
MTCGFPVIGRLGVAMGASRPPAKYQWRGLAARSGEPLRRAAHARATECPEVRALHRRNARGPAASFSASGAL